MIEVDVDVAGEAMLRRNYYDPSLSLEAAVKLVSDWLHLEGFAPGPFQFDVRARLWPPCAAEVADA